MATIGHLFAGMAVARASGRRTDAWPRARMAGLAAMAAAPDVDLLIYLHDGVHRPAAFAHRGFTHSVGAVVACGVVAFAVAKLARWKEAGRAGVVVAIAVATHGLIDMLSARGGPVAIAWPFSSERILLPIRPLPVAHFDPPSLFLRTELVELLAFAPLLVYALWPRRVRA